METSVVQYSPVYDSKRTENLRKGFTRLQDECYLDHAGATLYSESQVKKTADDLCSTLYGNPHSLGLASKLTLDIVDQTRYRILEYFHTNSDEYSVIFTSGATASLKLVAESFLFSEENASPGAPSGNFVYLQDNHTSVLGMRKVVAQRGAKIKCLNHEQAFHIFHKPHSQAPETSQPEKNATNSLFVYSAQCNFSGLKYPLRWIEDVQNGVLDNVTNERETTKWYTFLDAAGFAATNDLNLSENKPDFICLSFYKLFGYPTGIGALLVRNSTAAILKKGFYGGGTVQISLSSEMFHVDRPVLHERFEDGTISFLSIMSLRHGFDAISSISPKMISQHVFSLAKFLHDSLLTLHHSNGKPTAKLYSDTTYDDCNLQGGIVTFNLLRSNGETVGFVEVLNMASLYKIHLRTGCFCNPGACQRHLNLSDEDLLGQFNAGHVCGDERDLVNGKPTGAIRISFGYMSTIEEVKKLLKMLKDCFLDGPEVIKVPDWWEERKKELERKYYRGTSIKINERNGGTVMRVEGWKETVESGNYDFGQFCLGFRSSRGMAGPKVKHLFVYPVKSCAAYSVENSWILGNKGLEYDREWMIVTSAGVCLTQKQETKMCLVRPRIDLEKNAMELEYPGMPALTIPLHTIPMKNTNGTLCQSKVCGHRVEGTDCGADASEWLSLALGRPGLRLLRQNNQKKKDRGTAKDKPSISFASQAQYLLINEGSIQWLADRISEGCDKRNILHRFRGNIVVEGCDAFQEINWKHVQIGGCNFKVEGLCTRCQMICIDQITGQKTVEPLRTLAEEFHGKMRFGIYLSREGNEDTVIRVGDQLNYV